MSQQHGRSVGTCVDNRMVACFTRRCLNTDAAGVGYVNRTNTNWVKTQRNATIGGCPRNTGRALLQLVVDDNRPASQSQ